MSLSPSLVRAGESVSVRTTIGVAPGSRPGSGPSGVKAVYWSIQYPAGVTPQLPTFQIVPFPEGVFLPGKSSTGGQDHPDESRVGLVIGGTTGANDGPVADLTFAADAGMTPGTYALVAPTDSHVGGGALSSWLLAAPVSTPFGVTAPTAVAGDVDGNGRVTVADAVWALKLAVGAVNGSPGVLRSAAMTAPNGPTPTAEVSAAKVTVRDVIAILKTAAGLPAG